MAAIGRSTSAERTCQKMRGFVCLFLALGVLLGVVPALGLGARAASQARALRQGQPVSQTVRQSQSPSGDAASFWAAEAKADSVSALNALLLVAQREGDFASFLSAVGEKRRECSALQGNLLGLMGAMDPALAHRGAHLAAFLVEPSGLLVPDKAAQAIRVLLPFIQTIPESLSTFPAFCLAAGLLLRGDGQQALAGRYFEKAAGTGFVLSKQALYLGVECAVATRELDRLIELEKGLEEASVPDYLRTKARLVSGLALLDAGRHDKAEELLQSLLKDDISARQRAKAATALGRLYERRGEAEKAARSYAQALQTTTSGEDAVAASRAYLRLVKDRKIRENMSTTLSAARCLVRAGARSDARAVLERLFSGGTRQMEAGWELGRLLYRARSYAEAARVFRTLQRTEKNPASSLEALLWVARCERSISKPGATIEPLRRVALAGRRVKHAEAAWELALELESLGRLREGAETYYLLHLQAPGTRLGQEALWRKGLCEYKQGAVSQAQSTFASALKGAADDWRHDRTFFWMLKCSVEGGSPVPADEFAKEKPRDDSLYGLVLESISRRIGGVSPVDNKAGFVARLGKDVFEIPWADLRTATADSGTIAPAKSAHAQPSPWSGSTRLTPSDIAESELWEGLPPEAERGATLLRFGLDDLALEELRSCEKRLSSKSNALFLIAQLYWQNELYRQALSISDRLLKADRGLNETDRRFLERILHPICYTEALLTESRAQSVDPFLALAVMRNESSFDPDAVSPAGARGLMQLMPGTAGDIAAYLGEDTSALELTDPRLNIRYGIWHLGRLIGRYSDSVVIALAAYNAGEDNAERWLSPAGAADGFVYMESVSFRETRDYIRKVLTDFQVYRELYE